MISIVTPSVRPEMLEIVAKCLKRQTFKDFEWIIVVPQYLFMEVDRIYEYEYIVVGEPLKNEGDYYGLNKAWNQGFRYAQGELIVSLTDGLWFPPDLLERLWSHYETNPKSVVGLLGNQYDQVLNGKPEHMVWQDPRKRTDMGAYYETLASEIEWCIASFPRQAIYDVGGMPENYDKGAALSEKITNLRFEKAGYKLYLDQSLEYRAISHPRLSSEWDDKYKIAIELYQQDAKDILNGKNLKLDYIAEKE
ncbi:MAG TPA: glycosyltransferase [Patescibacteria group bacterium]